MKSFTDTKTMIDSWEGDKFEIKTSLISTNIPNNMIICQQEAILEISQA